MTCNFIAKLLSFAIGVMFGTAASASLIVPALSSKPQITGGTCGVYGSGAVMYLDFDGEPAQQWGSYNVPATPAMNFDADPLDFNATELNSINTIWQMVSYAYRDYKINVTTVPPPNGWGTGQRVAHVVIGGNGAWYNSTAASTAEVDVWDGADPEIAEASGVAYRGTLDVIYGATTRSSWVFSERLANYDFWIGGVAIHEPGHTIGMQHQSTWVNGIKTAEYADGPWMGVSFYGDASNWDRWIVGTASDGTTQDDMAFLDSRLGHDSIPEPTSAWLIVAGLALLMRRPS